MDNHHRKVAVGEKTLYLSCVIPVYNEEAVIASFLSALNEALKNITTTYEVIIVDDGSHDQTVQKVRALAEHYPIKLLVLSRNFGKEIALTAGIEHASGDVVLTMDADFQHPLDMIPPFLDEWANGYDMVYGERQSRQSETMVKRNFAKLFYWAMHRMTQIDMPKNAGDFRLMDKKVVAAFKQFPERTRFMKGLYAWVGFRKKAVPFEVQARQAGISSWHFKKLTELAITGITSFSDVPLRVWGWIGFFISSIALIYALYVVTVTLVFGADVPGYPTIVVAIMFLGGVQLLSIGILGEYIGRIFTEVKQRPKYLLQLKEGFDDKSSAH